MWGRGAHPNFYGAHQNLRNYGNIGAVNANTDITAEQYKRLASDCAASANTAPIATLLMRYAGGAVYVSHAILPWAPPMFDEYAGNAPPSALYPTATRSFNTVTFTLPSSAADEYGVVEPVIARVVVPFQPDASWDGPTGTSVFAITSTSFAAGSGTCAILVF